MSATAPWPEHSGNCRRMCSALRALRRLGPVDVFVFAEDVGDPPASLALSAVGRGPSPASAVSLGERVRWLLGRAVVPSEFVGLDAGPARAALTSWLEDEGRTYDVVWFTRAVAHLIAAPAVSGAHVVDLDDLEDQKLHDRLAAGVAVKGVWSGRRWPGWRAAARYKLRRNATGWRRLQGRVADQSSAVVLCSSDDRKRSGLPNAIVFPNCYPTPDAPLGRLRPGRAPTLLLIGLMRYRPNADGADWFAREVWPRVRRLLPTAELRIVGEVAGQVQQLGELPGVTVTGRVPSVDEELALADVSVVPIRFGGGTRLKILEAWAHRIPVVSTTPGAAGLGAIDGEHLLIADDAETFADACVRIIEEPHLRDGLASSGAAWFEERFTCEIVESALAADVKQLLDSRSE